jgi:hypothetical protein
MKYPNKKNFPKSFDSRFSKTSKSPKLKLEIEVTDEELSKLILFYQKCKQENRTTKLSLEQFIKEIIFDTCEASLPIPSTPSLVIQVDPNSKNFGII